MSIRSIIKWLVYGWLLWRIAGPEVPPRFREPQNRPMRVPGRSVIVGTKEFFFRETGQADAPPIVLIHGWAYDSEATWYAVAPLLAERYRVIMIDQRNHGRSDRIRGRYEIETVADEVAAVLDALDVGAATVVGYSMGGMVAQVLAKRQPHKVDRLVLIATAAYPIPARRPLVWLSFMVGRAIARISLIEGGHIVLRYLKRVEALPDGTERWMWHEILDRDPTLYYEGGHAVRRFDSRSWVGRLKMPTLIVIPTEDQLVPPAAQYELASLLPHAEVDELVGVGHEAAMNRGPEIAKTIAAFVG